MFVYVLLPKMSVTEIKNQVLPSYSQIPDDAKAC